MTCSMRIVADDAIASATLTAPTAAAYLGPARAQNDRRSQVCRLLGSSGTITAALAAPTRIGAVIVPASNLGPSGTIRVQAGAFDSGPLPAGGTADAPVDVNGFLFGATCSVVWLPEQPVVSSLTITLADPARPWIDVSRIVAGPYLQLQYGANYGVATGITDDTTQTRTASRDLITARAGRSRWIEFELPLVTSEQRPALQRILSRGIGPRIFVSLVPDLPDPALRSEHQIYGVPRSPPAMSWEHPTLHATSLTVDEF